MGRRGMGKLVGVGCWRSADEFLLEGVGISVERCTRRFDIRMGWNGGFLGHLELFVFGKVLGEKDREVVVKPFPTGFKLAFGGKK